jgi:type IV secretory pathway VirD2 relaxase
MPADDQLPIFRPRNRSRRVRTAQDSSLRLTLLSKIASAARRSYARGRRLGRAQIAVRPAGGRDRRVTVKARYVQGHLARSAWLHLAYVEREGIERDGSAGRLYNAEDRVPEAAGERMHPLYDQLLESLEGERHQFRLIVAPEDGAELDLTAYTRSLMSRVQKDLGQRLIWGAVNHHDTDNPHTHVIIRGVDQDGAEVRFGRAYISHGFRHRAQELATEELGPRTEQDIVRQRQREIRQGRLTSLDRKIALRAVDGIVRIKDLDVYGRERMRVLEQMRLAERDGRWRWRLLEGWQQQLRADGERGDIIKQLHRALKRDTRSYHVLRRLGPLPAAPSEKSGVIHGRVVSKGLSDDSGGGMYAVVESTAGTGYYVPLWRNELDAVREGDVVTLREQHRSRSRPIDQQLKALLDGAGALRSQEVLRALEVRLNELARRGLAMQASDGKWEMRATFAATRASGLERGDARTEALDALLEQAARSRDGWTTPRDAFDALEKRLEDLAQQKLASGRAKRRDREWRIDPEFEHALARLDHEQPQVRVGLRCEPLSLDKQVRYLGPTWLDGVVPSSDVGFSADVAAYKVKRQEFLQANGIEQRNLRTLERREVARLHAQALQRAVTREVEGFCGVLDRVHDCPNGNRYAIIVSESELAVVAAGNRAHKLRGRQVELSFAANSRDGRQKLTIVPAGRDAALDRGRGD